MIPKSYYMEFHCSERIILESQVIKMNTKRLIPSPYTLYDVLFAKGLGKQEL
jgi:hypothetical protein